MSHMRELDIHFVYTPYPLNKLPVDETIFCAIIGNLVDNAIEAVQRIDDNREKEIQFAIAQSRGMLRITCKNPTEEALVRRRGREFLSTKRRNAPGYGISSVRKSVEAAGGYCSFQVERGAFIADIVLPFAGE